MMNKTKFKNVLRHFLILTKFSSKGKKYTILKLLTLITRIYRVDFRFPWPEMDWWNDDEFSNVLKNFDEFDGYNSQRKYQLRELLKLVENLAGDTAECGTYKGASSYIMLKHSSRIKGSQHFIFDSFEGLSSPAQNEEHWSSGDLSIAEATVEKNLRPFKLDNDYFLYKGWIPNRFDEVADRKFKFIHIDVDLEAPTLDSIEFFYPRLLKGGILLCDDYGFETCPGATKSFNEFMSDKPENIIGLACGGGFIVKT